jgi:hypothetical protein
MSNPEGRKPDSLVGQRFGRLVVIDLNHYTYGQYHWNVQCDCGNTHIAATAFLRSGKVKSCGCLKKENRQRLRHGHRSGRKETKTYKSWSGMMARCYTPSTQRFEEWGGRGITVCERWHTFDNFLADMGECPEGKSIDRYPNNDGNYEPSNARWATSKEQASNRRQRKAKFLLQCEICNTEFKAIMPWAKNCSDECRNEANKRAQRAKKESI